MCVVSVLPTKLAAQSSESIGILIQLGELLGKTAEAVSKFADAIAHLVRTGVKGLDEVQARRQYNDLVELRRQITVLTATRNAAVINSISGYLQERTWQPSARRITWRAVTRSVAEALAQLEIVMGRFDLIKNEFVWEPAYTELQRALSGRRPLLERLKDLPEPQTAAEVAALRKAGDAYKALSDATSKASREMAEYVKGLRQ